MRLAHRNRVPEIMDDPTLDPLEHAKALRGLSRLNRLSRSSSIIWHEIKRMLPNARGTGCTLLDLASGGGDLPIAVAKRAQRAGVNLRVTGTDISPVAIEHAKADAERQSADVDFFVFDALNGALERQYDFVTASLFFHHLSDDEAVDLLVKMSAIARRGIVINDLCRGWGWMGLVWIGSRIVTTSHVVHVDGPRSIAAAFKPAEFTRLAQQSGLQGGTTRVWWPARFSYTWSRS